MPYTPKTIRQEIVSRRSTFAMHGLTWHLTLSCGHIKYVDTQAAHRKFRVRCLDCERELATLQK